MSTLDEVAKFLEDNGFSTSPEHSLPGQEPAARRFFAHKPLSKDIPALDTYKIISELYVEAWTVPPYWGIATFSLHGERDGFWLTAISYSIPFQSLLNNLNILDRVEEYLMQGVISLKEQKDEPT